MTPSLYYANDPVLSLLYGDGYNRLKLTKNYSIGGGYNKDSVNIGFSSNVTSLPKPIPAFRIDVYLASVILEKA